MWAGQYDHYSWSFSFPAVPQQNTSTAVQQQVCMLFFCNKVVIIWVIISLFFCFFKSFPYLLKRWHFQQTVCSSCFYNSRLGTSKSPLHSKCRNTLVRVWLDYSSPKDDAVSAAVSRRCCGCRGPAETQRAATWRLSSFTGSHHPAGGTGTLMLL